MISETVQFAIFIGLYVLAVVGGFLFGLSNKGLHRKIKSVVRRRTPSSTHRRRRRR